MDDTGAEFIWSFTYKKSNLFPVPCYLLTEKEDTPKWTREDWLIIQWLDWPNLEENENGPKISKLPRDAQGWIVKCTIAHFRYIKIQS